MRKIALFIVLLCLITIPVCALELTAPEVPEFAESCMPSEPENLSEGIMTLLKNGLMKLRPDLKEAARTCLSVGAVVMVVSLVHALPGGGGQTTDLAGSVATSVILLTASGSLVNLGADTVQHISEYGKLLLPVLTTALAAQGGITTSAALYSGTAAFDAVLSGLISRALIPLVYLFLAVAAANSAVGEDTLKKLRDTIKGGSVWLLKTILYIYTGFISITGVVSGATDAAALKAAKLTISGVVPVVGGILSDASEAVLVSAGTVKNAIGSYGLFAVLAIWMEPFLKIGTHYLLLRVTGMICSIFGSKRTTDLIQDFATAMGMLLAMTGSVCLMLLISVICFMRGVG